LPAAGSCSSTGAPSSPPRSSPLPALESPAWLPIVHSMLSRVIASTTRQILVSWVIRA
jgi:hypothetical protein